MDRDRYENGTPRPVSDLIIPVATPNASDTLMKYYSTSADTISKRSSSYFPDNSKNDLYLELEEKNKTVLMLTSLLQKKEEEIEMLKADLEDSVSELGTVCDKFNAELETLSNIYQFTSLSMAEQEQLPSEDRPSHPSPELQMKRKLENTLIERNQWQLRATELEHQLRLVLLNAKPFPSGGSSPQNQHKRHFSQGGGISYARQQQQ